jgi:hypothetical protein
MRTLLAAAVPAVTILALGAIPAGAKTLTCKSVATPTGLSGAVSATRVSCAKARSVAKTFANKGKAPKPWSCTANAYMGGATITCRRGSGSTQQRVRFQIAD